MRIINGGWSPCGYWLAVNEGGTGDLDVIILFDTALEALQFLGRIGHC